MSDIIIINDNDIIGTVVLNTHEDTVIQIDCNEYDTYIVPKDTKISVGDNTTIDNTPPSIEICIPASRLQYYTSEELKATLCKGMSFYKSNY